jgi:hypothetical protein
MEVNILPKLIVTDKILEIAFLRKYAPILDLLQISQAAIRWFVISHYSFSENHNIAHDKYTGHACES